MNTFKRSLIPAWVFIRFKPPEEGNCWELQLGACFSSYLSSLNFSGQSTGFVNPALLQRSISLIAKQFACLQHGGNQWPLITVARGHFWTLQQQTGCKLAQLCQNDLFTRPLNIDRFSSHLISSESICCLKKVWFTFDQFCLFFSWGSLSHKLYNTSEDRKKIHIEAGEVGTEASYGGIKGFIYLNVRCLWCKYL